MEQTKKASMARRIGMKIVIAASLISLGMPAFADLDRHGGGGPGRGGPGGGGGPGRGGPGGGHGDYGRGGHGDHGRGGWDNGRGGHDHGRGGYRPIPIPIPVPSYPRPNPYPYPYPYPAPNPYPYPTNPGYYTEYLQTFVNQTLLGSGSVSISSALNLNYTKYGKDIYEVKFQAKTMFGNGIAQLEINDRLVGPSIQVGSNLQEYSLPISDYGNRVGIEINSLRLRVVGAFYVSTVGVVIER